MFLLVAACDGGEDAGQIVVRVDAVQFAGLDLPLIFHPAATGARLLFTPNGVG